MKQIKNALIAQSGGPTAVINASLAGAINQYISTDGAGTIYGAVNGIKGVLRDDLINLSEFFNDENKLDLLVQTPSSFLGSCRYRLENINEESKQIISLFEKYDIGHFFYIGGNDSMDTVMKLAPLCSEKGINVIGIPKTIDNDLMGTDHCPGYGSSAKYIASVISQMALDAGCYDIKNVLIVEIMGRNAGWLTAASALSRSKAISAPDFIYLPERIFDYEKFLYDIRRKLMTQNTVVIAVSEGIKDADGKYIAESDPAPKKDMFGHGQLGGAGKKLELLVKKRLGIKVRSVELNIPQRCASHCTSLTDVTEAYNCGAHAVICSLNGETGKMITMTRNQSSSYSIQYNCTDVSVAANGERMVPDQFISQSGNDVTNDFIDYVSPLIIGEKNIKYVNGIPAYIVR